MAPDLLAYLWPAASYGLIESRALSGSSLKQYSRSGSGSSLDTDQLIISPLTIPSCHRAALPRHSPSTTLPPQPCHPFRRLVHIANSCPPPPPPPCHPWCVHNDGASLSPAIRSTVTFATSLYPALFARGPFKLLPNAERAEEAKNSAAGHWSIFIWSLDTLSFRTLSSVDTRGSKPCEHRGGSVVGLDSSLILYLVGMWQVLGHMASSLIVCTLYMQQADGYVASTLMVR